VGREHRKLAAILVADVVGYSKLVGSDEAGTLGQLQALRREVIDPAISKHSGRLFKAVGDGFLVEFASAVQAVNCAKAVQDANTAGALSLRIGIHVGDVVVQGDDLMGDGVNIAARVEGLAEPGGIAISRAVHEQVRGKTGSAFVEMGAQTLKNIDQKIEVWQWARGGVPTSTMTIASLAPPDKPSIAVLPFQNMSGDPEQEYFADGISEDLITALSKLSQLFVIARNSSFSFKGKNVHVREVARNLGVRHVLEGSVRKSGNRVRVTAQLVDVNSGGHLWAERFDRELTDIFAVQDDVTSQIVAALAVSLTPRDHQRRDGEQTQNPEAYDCFLRGRQLWYLLSRDANSQARAILTRATELAPGFAPAYAFLAAAHINDSISRWSSSPRQSLELGYQAALRAVALDERYPYTNWALALSQMWRRNHDEAIRAAKRSIELNPNFADGFTTLGIILHYAGRSEEALGNFERAVTLDPLHSPMVLHFQAQAAFQLGQYEMAASLLKRRIVRNPETDASRVLLAATYGQMSRIKEAREAWDGALRANPDYSLEHRRKMLPYKNPADFDLVVEGLRKAGIDPYRTATISR
jgi:adenylate cyclase